MTEDHKIPPVRMDQAMALAADMVVGLFKTFTPASATEDEAETASLICLSIFLYQLLTPARQKTKVAGLLRAIIVELEDPQEPIVEGA